MIRLGIIGAGDVAERDYLPEWHRLEGEAVISVVCGRSPERARRVAEQYGIDRWSTNYREVVQSDVDAIVNLTPINLHYPITLAALEAGKHVYTEKPMASSPAQAEALEHLASERGLVLVCAPSFMLFPQIAKVGQLLASGDLGVVHAARAQALTGPPPWPGYGSDPSFFFESEAGPLVDMGVYPLHVLTGLLGPVSGVAAMAARTMQSFVVTDGPFNGKVIGVEAEDTWQVIARLGGCIASIEANFSTVGSAAADCELRGERAAVAFSLFDVSAPISLLPAGESDWTDIPVTHEREAGPDHLLGIRELLECIAEGRTPVPNARHAIHVLEIIGGRPRIGTDGPHGDDRASRQRSRPRLEPGSEMTMPHSSGSSAGTVRLGIVGVGALTLRALLPHLCGDDLDGTVSVTALCDPVPGRAADAAATYGVAKSYQAIEDLLADDDIDAVTVPSPIGLHAAHGKMALSA